MNVETYSLDPDNTCGQNCDPQTCDFTMNPPVCTPALDPGFSSTLRAPAGNGSFGNPDAVGNPSLSNTTYTCNPLFPGPTEICVVATDGDNDCDRIRCTTIICPDLCEGVVCDDGNECTRDLCNPLDGSCSNDDAPNGIACSSCAGTCQAGVCDLGLPFTAAQTGTVMTFTGALQPLNTTLVNPYSGMSTTITGGYNLNTSSYLGVGPSAVLIGTNLGDALFVQDPVGTQRICGVNEIIAGVGFDVMFLADAFVILKGMIVTGGDTSDTLWGNVGDDMISGNRGMDLIDGGPGNDIIDGGNGDDTITLWPGGGSDSISGGLDIDTLEIDAIQSQILIEPAADTLYEYDIWYLGTLMAEIREVELIVMNDRSIDLATCTGGPGDVCNLCGNDALNGTEGCDDGNNVDGDGCAADCTAEY
jgi:cysteine-rich repeat protein